MNTPTRIGGHWRWAGIVWLSLLTACAHARSYPICLYDTTPSAARQSEADWPALRGKLAQAAALVTGDPADVLIVTSRSAVIRTTRQQDARLRAIWPSIACYGESSGTLSVQVLEACMDFVSARIELGSKCESAPPGITTPACLTVREGGQPDR